MSEIGKHVVFARCPEGLVSIKVKKDDKDIEEFNFGGDVVAFMDVREVVRMLRKLDCWVVETNVETPKGE